MGWHIAQPGGLLEQCYLIQPYPVLAALCSVTPGTYHQQASGNTYVDILFFFNTSFYRFVLLIVSVRDFTVIAVLRNKVHSVNLSLS